MVPGLRCAAAGFLQFINQFSDELVTLNSAERVRHGEVREIQSVTPGAFKLTFHTEFGHVPGRPDFLSFWCEVPATSGGQTLLVDGVALWNALSEPTRDLFLSQRIRYVMAVPKPWWTARLQSDKIEDVARAVDGIPDFDFELRPDGTLMLTWRTSAAFRPNFSSELCFASNVFPYVVPGLTLTFEDGSRIPEAVTDELTRLAESLAAEIEWKAGEVVFVDNTRWLHGRRAVEGPRRMHVLQGYLRFAPENRIRIKRALQP